MNIEDEEGETKKFLAALETGLELFNQQKFFEAYEVWSARWEDEVTEGADLLQGLLQIAVGFAKLHGGSPRGTVKLLQSGSDKLMLYSPEAYGVDVDGFLELVKTWRGVAERMVEQGGADGIEAPPPRIPKKTSE